jgi:hypothetical protein
MLHPSLTQTGSFVIGCNYWASHAGTHMWCDWQPDVVAADLKQLAEAGLQVLRVFPLWPDFQPITQLYGGGGNPQEIRHGEEVLNISGLRVSGFNSQPANMQTFKPLFASAGISPDAMAHFATFADLAQENGLKLIVGLLTGWMSGRLFVPPALEGRNVLTDPVAMVWETRFVRAFVRTFKEHPAILAWDLGNECNCMAAVPSADAAWAWTSAISNAIRVEDPSRPVVSGMHSLDEPDENGPWRIAHQSELTDVLTTHPYPYFTPHCDQEPINTLRNGLHATAQTRWYSDVGGVPGLAEEVGTLGPMFASESIAADYARMALFSLWANDCHGLLWWCAYDQDRLAHAPYDWTPIERELGLIRSDRSPKPVLQAFSQFRRFLDSLPQPLPARQTEAVCILTHGQEQWGIAYASFILAKQAGFDITFQYADQPLKEAALYLMPSVSGGSPFSRHFWYELDEKVRAGATLYLSLSDGILSPFKQPFGLEVQTRQKRTTPAEITLTGLEEAPTFAVRSPARYNLYNSSAVLLGQERDGNPAFTCHNWGDGCLYFLSVPIEQHVSNTPGAFVGDEPYWQIYRHIVEAMRSPLARRVFRKDNPLVGITEHPLDEHQRTIVLINYSPTAQNAQLTLAEGWKIAQSWYGPLPDDHHSIIIPANDAAIFVVRGNEFRPTKGTVS